MAATAVIPIGEYCMPPRKVPHRIRPTLDERLITARGFRRLDARGLAVPRNIFVEELVHTPIEEQGTEIVERKGIGHPDSVADGLAADGSRPPPPVYPDGVGG